MNELPIEARIYETTDGTYYPVKLQTVPRVGELIDFFSYLDQANNCPPTKHYEVVQVLHEIHDVSDEIPQSKNGHQFITVFVKPSHNQYFK